MPVARFPTRERIQVGRWENYLRRLFNLKGPQLGGLAPDVVTTVPLGLVMPMDQRFPQGIHTYGIQQDNPAGGAGNTNLRTLSNPVGSGIIVVVESAVWEGAVATDVTFRLIQGVTAGASGFSLDTRSRKGAPVPGSASGAQVQNTVAVPPLFDGNFFTRRAVTFASFPNYGGVPQGVVIQPGFQLQVFAVTPNLADRLFLQWMERAIEATELAG